MSRRYERSFGRGLDAMQRVIAEKRGLSPGLSTMNDVLSSGPTWQVILKVRTSDGALKEI